MTIEPGFKKYLSDGVYLQWDGNRIILTAEDGILVSNRIYINSEVLEAFEKTVALIKKCTQETQEQEKDKCPTQ